MAGRRAGLRYWMTARCVGGPYAGQTFEIPRVIIGQIHWHTKADVGPLMWINHGTNRHCYQLVSNGWYAGWRLVFRDTF
jgi:hypothetical protein